MAQATPSISSGTLSCANTAIRVESQDWWNWLNNVDATTFRFTNSTGSFTARCERKDSGWYWYAYRRRSGKLRKAYLGKSEELTLERLNFVATVLANNKSGGHAAQEKEVARADNRDARDDDAVTAHNGSDEASRTQAEWYERNGFFVEAIRYALAAADYPFAARLIEESGERMFQLGEVVTLKSWLDLLPDHALQNRPRLYLLHAATLISIGQLDLAETRLHEAEQVIDEMQQQLAGIEDPERAAYIERALGELAVTHVSLVSFRGDAPRARKLSHRALKLLPEENVFMRSVVFVSLATAYALNGNVSEASQALAEARVVGQAAKNTHIILASISGQAYLWMEQGQLSLAAEIYWQSLQLSISSSGKKFPVASIACIGLGELQYQWNDLDAATRNLQEGIDLGELWGDVLLHARGYAILARVKNAQGDGESAIAVTRRAEQQGLRYNVTEAVTWAGTTRARIWLAQGNIEAAFQWAQGSGLAIDDPLHYMNEYEYITLARVLIAKGQGEDALKLLAGLLHLAEAEGRQRSVIEILVLQALAFNGQDNPASAMDMLTRALCLAEPEVFIRVFVDEGVAMVALLMRLVEAKQKGHLFVTPPFSLSYVVKLLEALGICIVLPGEELLSRIVQPLIDPLSERELTVLQLIDSGLSNSQIANEMIVAVSTVKWHIKHIYGKLNVHSRTQVLARARELGLLI